MDILVYFIAIILISLTGITIINVVTFPRLQIGKSTQSPTVSILIPARNEANTIGQTVQNLLQQTYTQFELIILDDNSTDDTGRILSQFEDDRLTVINGEALPDGWMGKSWACHQLSQHASNEILIFTDADVQWAPHALAALLSQMQDHDADLFTVWSTQHTITPAERLTVPLMAFAILTYLPTFMTHITPFSVFAAANGQCMAWKRDTYNAIGGHTSVANNILDDVTLAKRVKKSGYTLRMADGNRLISCRMYDSWSSVRNGFAKNILAGYGNSVLALSVSIIFHTVVFLLPVLLVIFSTEYRIWAGVFVIQAMLIRALSARFTHQRTIDAVGMPISVVLMTIIALQSILWNYTGGPRWKGRTITTSSFKGHINV